MDKKQLIVRACISVIPIVFFGKNSFFVIVFLHSLYCVAVNNYAIASEKEELRSIFSALTSASFILFALGLWNLRFETPTQVKLPVPVRVKRMF